MFLDALILNFNGKEKLPVNFKKLLEFYVDLLMKTQSKPDAKLVGKMTELEQYAALKTVVKQILKC